LCCKEHDADMFRLIRRHESDLDRWFTQRLGYRLHVDADTARLFKTTYVPTGRPLRTPTGRPFGQIEYVMLALILASTAAGPAVISLRDLVDQVRSAAAEADIVLSDRPPERRALVWALKWMIAHGLAAELHAHVDAYATDETADAVLKMRPDRVAMLPLPNLVGAVSRDELLDRADRRDVGRRWMRARLVEDPVLYRRDLDDGEWGELRRRLGEEVAILDEMFGLVLESRAEGLAAIDPTGALADQKFPTGGTVGHAALLVLDGLPSDGSIAPRPVFDAHIAALASDHAKGWANDLVEHPDRLAKDVLRLLIDLRLAELVDERTGIMNPSSTDATATSSDGGRPTDVPRADVGDRPHSDPSVAGRTIGTTASNGPRPEVADRRPSQADSGLTSTNGQGHGIRLLPAAGRFLAVVAEPTPGIDVEQPALW
jgi:uncharacterized protein (TIGR02678 family)